MPTALGTVASHRSVFSPIPMGGLARWWDADDASTIAASAGAVSQWRDKSGGNHHLTQIVEANKPTTGTRTINGRNALDFTNDWLSAATAISHPWVAFLVIKSDVGPSAARMNILSGELNSCFISSEDNSGAWYVQGNGWMYFNRSRDTKTHIITVVADASLAWTSFYDRAQTATANTSNNWGFLSTCVGSHWDGSLPFDGLIGEVIIYNRELATVERQEVENYLHGKWLDMTGGQIPSTGLTGWWDASTLTNADGTRITSWPDLSGNGRTLTGPGPTFTANALNEKGVATFNGSVNNSLATSVATIKHLFVVTKYDGATFAEWDGLLGDTSSLVILGGMFGTSTWWDGSPSFEYYMDGVAYSKPWPAPMQKWAVLSVPSESTWGAFALLVGSDRGIADRWWGGGVAEVIAYDRVLSTVERQQVESYLAEKWLASGPEPPEQPWSPWELPNLMTWIDAADTTSISETDGAVTQINDVSGNGRHFVGGANKPTTGTTKINGRNVLNFAKGAATPGSMDRLTLDAGANILDLDTYTILFVVRLYPPVDGGRMVALATTTSIGPGGDTGNGGVLAAVSGPYAAPPNIQSYAEAGGGPYLSVPPGVTVRLRTSKQGTTWKVAVDDVEATATMTSILDLIRYIHVGSNDFATGHGFIGALCELVVCNAPLSSTDLEEWKDYVDYKWLGIGGGGTGNGTTFHIPPSINDDGTVEVGAEINAWLATVPNNAIVEFTAGATYWTEETLYCAGRHDMVFEGNRARFEQHTRGDDTAPIFGFHQLWPRSRAFWLINGGSNLEFRNFNFYGANPTGANGYSPYMGQAYEEQQAFHVDGAHGVKILDNYATRTYGDFASFAADARDCQVIGNFASCLGRQGVSVVYGSDILIQSNTFDHISRSAFDAEPMGEAWETRRITIDDNDVSYFINTFFANLGGGGAVSDITVTNNRLGQDAAFIVSCEDRVPSGSGMRRHNYTFSNNSSMSLYGSPISLMHFFSIDNVLIEGTHHPIQGKYPSPTDGSVYSGIFTSFDDCTNCTVRNNVAYEYPVTYITTHGVTVVSGDSAASVIHCGNITDELQAGPPVDGVCP